MSQENAVLHPSALDPDQSPQPAPIDPASRTRNRALSSSLSAPGSDPAGKHQKSLQEEPQVPEVPAQSTEESQAAEVHSRINPDTSTMTTPDVVPTAQATCPCPSKKVATVSSDVSDYGSWSSKFKIICLAHATDKYIFQEATAGDVHAIALSSR